MIIVWILLGAALFWVIARTLRKAQTRGGDGWRVGAGVLAAVSVIGAVTAASRGGWLLAVCLAVIGVSLALSARRGMGAATPAQPEVMTEREARSTLGVPDDAGPDEIETAYRRLMRRVHPDQGGAEGLAARLNAARQRLKG
ncbi:J domain-containing protein [Brevundimonas sp. 2R-24]|uniref:J domain-containing protein n=1 Tax=Peiella sedimenti TaxID=3061083 RepID=A0ABT8SIU9_9CAUL|nr:J domain-containing protein [Caulobacteraceae bacterium XZ-24]